MKVRTRSRTSHKYLQKILRMAATSRKMFPLFCSFVIFYIVWLSWKMEVTPKSSDCIFQSVEPAKLLSSGKHLELYVRYNTKEANGKFSRLVEAWLFRSVSLFWPRNTSLVVVLDEELEADWEYGCRLKNTTRYKQLELRVCYMAPYSQDMIHHWGKMRMYLDMMHADLCTNAAYVGLVDYDTVFTTAVTPSLLFEDGRPVVTGRIGEPRIPCWIQTAEYVLGVKQVMQCMHYFPVTFKTAHISEMREYVTKLHGKDFKDVFSEASGKVNVASSCYCHYSIMCNYMWYHHRNEYAWHLQYINTTHPLNASVPDEYFFTEVKPYEKIPHPRTSQHIRHYMFNGKFMDYRDPPERFVNDTLIEGLCYSFEITLCGDLCEGYNRTRIHANLFNFENYDWLWDDRCMEKQIEHYRNVSHLFSTSFFYLGSQEEVCNEIKQLSSTGMVSPTPSLKKTYIFITFLVWNEIRQPLL
ncbi:uncharacterized protein [Montipora capricornis]|uniref:uncharacterized protein n=1 Tax=Montipora capricornis TaxID=246305 RepID=UPI0035F16865